MKRSPCPSSVLRVAAAALLLPFVGCAGGSTGRPPVGAASPPGEENAPPAAPSAAATPPASAEPAVTPHPGPLPGMPPVLDPSDIYSEDRPGRLSPVVKDFPSRVYVPNSKSNTVDVIDPHTFKIVDHFAVGVLPQHVTPSWDLKTLWVLNDLGNSVTRIDPATGKKGQTLPVDDPYNMYYTPDGKYAIVVAEQRKRLDFRDAHTMKLQRSLHVPCPGVDHLDFSADGRYLIASCEFGAKMIKVDVAEPRLLGTVALRPGGMPQDVKLSPDGKVFYVADMKADGVYMIDGEGPSVIGFIPTGLGTHGLYASRDSKYLYVSNRGEGSVSLIEFATRTVARKWKLPGGGSPDMGGVSADGKVLWLSGRYHSEVYAIDTESGKLLARIKVGREPHGLCVYPQPGRYSLGHTGVFR
jgi:YVTN family beta-propeller protein